MQEEADDKQRGFERARAVLDAQLRQLSGHISSKEALIVKLQHDEQEARVLSQSYLVGTDTCMLDVLLLQTCRVLAACFM
jgi:hypothetical protein